MATTFSIVAVFIPVAFMGGIPGLFIRSFVRLFVRSFIWLLRRLSAPCRRVPSCLVAASRLSSSLSSRRHLALSRFVSSRLILSRLASSLHRAPSCILPRPLCLFDCCIVMFHLVACHHIIVLSCRPSRLVITAPGRRRHA